MKNDYEYKMINTQIIAVDRMYQRDIREPKIKTIVKEWDDRLVNAPKLSYRDGQYWVFDGQHTVAAFKVHNGNKDGMIECKIFYGLTEKDECDLFLLQEGVKAKLSTNDILKAKNNFDDPVVCGMVHAVESCGLSVNFKADSSRTNHNKINATGALLREYKKASTKAFVDGLSAIKKAWGGSSDSLRGEMLKAVIEFCNTYEGEYQMDRLVKALKGNDPLDIVRMAKSQLTGGNAKYPRVILFLYNKKLQNKLVDKF